jgi:hypothetical protein
VRGGTRKVLRVRQSAGGCRVNRNVACPVDDLTVDVVEAIAKKRRKEKEGTEYPRSALAVTLGRKGGVMFSY